MPDVVNGRCQVLRITEIAALSHRPPSVRLILFAQLRESVMTWVPLWASKEPFSFL
jgi:hypothetical protein